MNDSQPKISIQNRPLEIGRTPFGQRWGEEIVELEPCHLEALKKGQVLAIDVQSEYVVNVRLAQTALDNVKEEEES